MLSVPTRWNSTYFMLNRDIKYEGAILNYIDRDVGLTHHLEFGHLRVCDGDIVDDDEQPAVLQRLKIVISGSMVGPLSIFKLHRLKILLSGSIDGEVIISEEPYVSVPNKSAKCEWCFASTNLKRCSACRVVFYCGNTCQKSDWKLHRVECQALSKVDKERIKSITPSIRLMVKLYLRRKLQDEKVILTTVMDNYNLVESLVSHMTDIDEKQLVLYAQMANLVGLILQWAEINVKEIAENFSKFSCNAHTVCDAELKPLGTGLYPVVSIINHSCLPNSVLIFEGRLAVIRAVQHIPKGTEVSISYIEMAGTTATRQKALKEQYLFSCTCIRCVKLGQNDDIQESAFLEGYRCKDKKCSGFLLRDFGNKGFTCQLCGLFRDKEEIKNIVNEIQSLSEKASFSLSYGSIL
ncbi:Histone-lysine N-methyltransferase ASHR1 [Capsicum baccatum]|uniref:Histone-lysine N-methyltransferase ASHR1 n=1 Tax=Capsicum baccatum TaxID=33114 RepID=A0A2G2WJX2_CAPBA|nr:Histone-lysine N-methyltransferase ASHR1 [Capsicum baccatum]